MPGDTLFDAISGAIDEVTPKAPEPDETTHDEAEDTGADTGSEGDAAADDGADEGATPPDGGGDSPESKGGKDSEDGKEAAAPGADAAKPEGDQKPSAAEAKPKDPVNDPLPPNLKEGTRERMVKLIDTAKTLTTRAETAERERDEIMQAITESQATPEQYGMALDYLRAVNSNDPGQQRAALDFLRKEVAVLSQMLGEPTGADDYAAHEDLKAAVDAGQVTKEIANEIAATRAQKQFQTAQSQHREQVQTTQQQQTQLRQHGMNALNTLEAELKKDPHYATKRPQLIAILKPILARTDPRLWAETAKHTWANLSNPAPVTAAQRPTGIPANQPLRARQPAGGQAKAPKNLQEAILNIDFSKVS